MQKKFTTRTILITTTVLAIAISSALVGTRWLTRYIVGIHQSSVTREILEWTAEYEKVNDAASALQAAEMLGYIKTYYPVNDDYRGSDETERELETSRAKCMRRLIDALEAHTGNSFGDDHLAWVRWADSEKNGEPSDAPE